MNDNNKNAEPWYVMCHLNPRQIEVLLKKECEGRFDTSGRLPSPFRFYIPFLYMPIAEIEPIHSDSSSLSMYTRELRNDFHNFVFIQASGNRVDEIVTSDWNTKSRLRLYYYRDHEGKNVVVPDSEIQQLMSTFKDETLKFFIGQPIDEFSAGDKVILNIASWAGQKGIIKDISLKKGRLNMTISLNIFNSTKSINFTNLKTGDVIFEDAAKEKLFSGDLVDQFEEEVIDLLSHRFSHSVSAEVAQADVVRLKRLSIFDRLYMEESDTSYARFLALKLICASLRQNRKKKEALQNEVSKLLADTPVPTTSDEAYLMMALFVSTRLARYRDAVKAYRTSHPDSPDVLRRFHSIVKKLKAKSG